MITKGSEDSGVCSLAGRERTFVHINVRGQADSFRREAMW